MKSYIAYFDYLGFKEFILNNDSAHLKKRAGHLLRDVEGAITENTYRPTGSGAYVADLSKSVINCITISDTVIFWTKDDSAESRQIILSVAHQFNWQNLFYNMPARGVVCYDELDIIHGQHTNPDGLIYSPNLIYGKGIVRAHIKAESLSWAGCVIDESVLDAIQAEGGNVNNDLEQYAKLYDVPYKKAGTLSEYAMKVVVGTLNEESFKNSSNNVRARFGGDNKSVENPRVQEILNNTLAYLETFREANVVAG